MSTHKCEWREVIENPCIIHGIDFDEDNPRATLMRLIAANVEAALEFCGYGKTP